MRWRPGLRSPGPAAGAYSAPPHPLAGLRGPTSNGRGNGGDGNGGEGEEGRGGNAPLWSPENATERYSNIPTGITLTGASNADEVSRNRDSEPISACCNPATSQVLSTRPSVDHGHRPQVVTLIAGSKRRCWLWETTTKCLWQKASTLRQTQQSSAFNCTQWQICSLRNQQ